MRKKKRFLKYRLKKKIIEAYQFKTAYENGKIDESIHVFFDAESPTGYSVYTYHGKEIVLIGDYIIKNGDFVDLMAKNEFESKYERVSKSEDPEELLSMDDATTRPSIGIQADRG